MPKGIPQPRPLLSNVGRRSCVNEYAHLLLLFSLAPNGLDSIESRQMNTPNHRLVEMHFGYENNILIHTVSWHLVTRKNCQCDCLFVSSEPIARLGLSLKCYPFQRGRHAPFLSKTNNNCSCLIIRSEPMDRCRGIFAAPLGLEPIAVKNIESGKMIIHSIGI